MIKYILSVLSALTILTSCPEIAATKELINKIGQILIVGFPGTHTL